MRGRPYRRSPKHGSRVRTRRRCAAQANVGSGATLPTSLISRCRPRNAPLCRLQRYAPRFHTIRYIDIGFPLPPRQGAWLTLGCASVPKVARDGHERRSVGTHLMRRREQQQIRLTRKAARASIPENGMCTKLSAAERHGCFISSSAIAACAICSASRLSPANEVREMTTCGIFRPRIVRDLGPEPSDIERLEHAAMRFRESHTAMVAEAPTLPPASRRLVSAACANCARRAGRRRSRAMTFRLRSPSASVRPPCARAWLPG